METDKVTPLNLQGVIKATTLSRSTIYQLCKEGRFPKPRRLLGSRTVWLESEVQGWLREKLGEASK
ncbi:AlpA family phage regulatory protein [Acidithiobacillus sp. CV18-2]|nr:AlpA family phage regulatory protein [Acidithiobacillus sp. CV18-3]MBU2758168.1 AlpA family phage regulatory protein [Acidithiobacillus sp. BN09-2]MBU2776248.1 AlpA family phage regulatory protein [Acidithiobacillus sp. CV18-2]MBU2799953.1 AlpA family phage regulatory protein [Acidithiobacillus sp. VAN18-4]